MAAEVPTQDSELTPMQAVFYAAFEAYALGRGWDLTDKRPEDVLSSEQMTECGEAAKRVARTWALGIEEGAMDRLQAQAEEGMYVESGFGAMSRRPFVTIGLRKGDEPIQARPEAARSFGFQILDCAAGAEQDGVIVSWLEEKLGLGKDEAAHALLDMRKYRERSRAADREQLAEPSATLDGARSRQRGIRRNG